MTTEKTEAAAVGDTSTKKTREAALFDLSPAEFYRLLHEMEKAKKSLEELTQNAAS